MNPGLSKAYFDETYPDAMSRFKNDNEKKNLTSDINLWEYHAEIPS